MRYGYATPWKKMAMTTRKRYRSMLSPIYFRLEPAERKQLIKEYCELFTQVSAEQQSKSRE